MAFEVSTEAGVATFTLNNPPQNRLNTELMMGFAGSVEQLKDDDSVRVLVIRAEGDNFSFGGEIAGWDMTDPEQTVALFGVGLQITNAFEQLPFPVIAAVHGNCFGGGFEIALRADVIVAAESAKFCHTEAALGMFTLLGGVQRVAERAGRSRAARWALTSERVSAADAFAAGVVAEVVPDAELAAVTAQWAARLACGATRAHATHKTLLNAWANGGVKAADALIPELAAKLIRTADAKNGVASAVDADAAGIARPDLEFTGH
ncbi:enoyl-CoA hydratase/isomerase family protein [Antrihabitans sp. YC2-6]|uniref:enoyl-CoA hydratase/isomerase family protein n=1 Tax=Antrihabitans sp. YC2-6 TaxID=2799498 RepID=UPI0018F6DFC6|nr:enoyl-CoA hydratase/isomerase family protein [Antrihabitans sp. YC2-6]MBJ8345654.1 enoyl-CoA hydratase/isomerase family protein [Antrihabitans sp. YC2-6]